MQQPPFFRIDSHDIFKFFHGCNMHLRYVLSIKTLQNLTTCFINTCLSEESSIRPISLVKYFHVFVLFFECVVLLQSTHIMSMNNESDM